MTRHGAFSLLVLLLAVGCEPAPEPQSAADASPARRIVTLAPHLTELVYSAGAGDRLVGVVAHSDFPPPATALPVIGDAFRVDLERLARLDPDLVLAWASGNPDELVAQLRGHGYRVVELATGQLADVADHLERIGKLAATETVARQQAQRFRSGLSAVRRQYREVRPVSVFYQISARPLYTVGRPHPINEMIQICGGRNIFADLGDVAPVVSIEDVLLRRPEVIIAGPPPGQADVLGHWARWDVVPAVRHGHLYTVEASLVARSSTRILEGLRQICQRLDRVRGTTGAAAKAADAA